MSTIFFSQKVLQHDDKNKILSFMQEKKISGILQVFLAMYYMRGIQLTTIETYEKEIHLIFTCRNCKTLFSMPVICIIENHISYDNAIGETVIKVIIKHVIYGIIEENDYLHTILGYECPACEQNEKIWRFI